MKFLSDLILYFDLHMGVSRWRERWIKQGRHKGVWDASCQRETLVLQDGRSLTYFLDGNLLERQNLPYIFCFHAMFLSGNSFLMQEAPKNCILVCINRPGYFGSSQVDADYCYCQFAHDMEQLADHLNVQTFCVVGHSSGGPCALACAAELPQRISTVGILSGDPEYAHEGIPDKRRMNAFLLGTLLPCFLKYVICFLPMARNGIRGLQNDFRLETSRYSFRTEMVGQTVIVFAGENDTVLPFEVSRHVHERLDNAELKIIPRVGHLGLLRDNVLTDMFDTLVRIESDGSEEPKVV